ncbi:MAG: hypothetical protein ABS84_03880 [Rubrivivax sp. SCN 71-131]|nr:MAG: hypothetical protein ABS84_03880 [Rubrivivax sp. SCN 71-131]
MVVTAAVAARVIHVVPPGGGGVERCVRDIVRQRPQDLILHTADAQCVLERPAPAGADAQARFVPLAHADLLGWAAAGGLGAPLILHAHGTVAAVRDLCEGLAAATAAPRLLTLHDIWFADPSLPDDERAQRLAFVRSAALRCAPSAFIAGRARAALGADADAAPVIEWPLAAAPFDAGFETPISPAAEQAGGARGFSIAVIGAIGAHKGLAALEVLAARLPATLRVVVLGYTERQLRQGWTADGRIWVHGIFHPDQLPRLAQHYGARLALFPPGMPESHCYALGDAWMSGLPVLAPDHGALAERIRRHGGGTVYDPAIEVDDWCALVVAQAAAARRHPGALPLLRPLPTMEEMMSRLEALYAELPPSGAARPADDDGVQRLAQKHLDSQFLRREVTDLQQQLERCERERDALREQTNERQAAVQQHAQALAACERRLAATTQEREAFAAAYLGLRGRLQRLVVGWLPDPLRRALVALARRLRG